MNITVLFLVALTAVTQAAFTASLAKDAQPVLAQGMLKLRLTSRNAAQKDLTVIIQSHANDILNQLEALVNAGYQIAEATQSHLSGILAQLHTGEGKGVITTTVAVIGTVASVINAVPTVVNAVTSAWNWLFGRNLGFDGNFLDVLGNLSITDVLSLLANYATNLISQLDLGSLLQHAVHQIIPKPIADLLTNQPGFGRGYLGDLWGSVSTAAAGAWDSLSGVADGIYETAVQSFAHLQQLATEFATNAWTEANAITSDAAQQLMAFLKPYQQDLGALYDQVAAQLSQFLSK